jgi:basic membrane lipoprotein Med (substrate-binding protein (PBP1-ABC) superfamily)
MKSRRDFVKTSTMLGAGLVLAPSMSFGMSNSTKEKLNIALIGVGAQGDQSFNEFITKNRCNYLSYL